MAFSQFTMKKVREDFGLQIIEDERLFTSAPKSTISEFLRKTLDRNLSLALAVNTEFARSSLIIAPILGDLWERMERKIMLFSGIKWSVEPEKGLEGYCDYIVSRSPEMYYLVAPVMAIVEAKKEDIIGGFGQCLATMYAATLFNKSEAKEIPCVYGCVTSGTVWRFLKLEENKGYVDLDEYYLNDIEKLLGILTSIVEQPSPVTAH